jgi:putative endonuclease
MSQSRSAWVYIMASRKNGTLYVGVTTCIRRRIWQHKVKILDGFTTQHRVTTLVHCEEWSGIKQAIDREKTIKGWKRNRNTALIEALNPDWDDLAKAWF